MRLDLAALAAVLALFLAARPATAQERAEGQPPRAPAKGELELDEDGAPFLYYSNAEPGWERERLEPGEFYDVAGRHDLAVHFNERAAFRRHVVIGGTLLVVASTLLLIGDAVYAVNGLGLPDQPPPPYNPGLAAGLAKVGAAGLGLGIGFIIVAAAGLNPDDVGADGRRRILDESRARSTPGASSGSLKSQALASLATLKISTMANKEARGAGLAFNF